MLLCNSRVLSQRLGAWRHRLHRSVCSASLPTMSSCVPVKSRRDARSSSTYVSSHYQLSDDEVAAYLRKKQLLFRSAGDRLVVKECPFCHPHKNAADNLWKLYIWVDSGRCYCHRCGLNCSFFDFTRHLDDAAEVTSANNLFLKPSLTTALPQVDQTKAAISRSNLRSHPDVLEYLTKSRGLSLEVLEKYGVGVDEAHFANETTGLWNKEKCITFPWARMVEDIGFGPIYVDRLKYRSIVKKSNQRLEPRGGAWGLFGWHTISASAEEIVITEGEFDAMSVYQATGLLAVSLPNGARSLPINILPCLERFKTIILWMDDDIPGQEGVLKFSKKLGLKRCRIVRSKRGMANGPKDANEALLKSVSIADLIKSAARPQHEQILGIADLRADVLDEVLYGSKYIGVPFATLPTLQALLKGHRKGELTVFTGPTGLGKTTILSQMSLDLCTQGVNTLWGSFEIKNHRLAKNMIEQLEGKSLELARTKFEELFERFQTLPLYFLKFFGSTDIHQVLEAMKYAVYVHDVDHILLDNLQFMLGANPVGGSKFDVQEQAISLLRKFATIYNVHITLVIHPRKEAAGQSLSVSSVFGSARATQEADNVFILQASDACKEVRYISLQKNRYDGETGEIPFKFDRPCRRIVELDAFEKEQLRNSRLALRNGQEPGAFTPSRTDHKPWKLHQASYPPPSTTAETKSSPSETSAQLISSQPSAETISCTPSTITAESKLPPSETSAQLISNQPSAETISCTPSTITAEFELPPSEISAEPISSQPSPSSSVVPADSVSKPPSPTTAKPISTKPFARSTSSLTSNRASAPSASARRKLPPDFTFSPLIWE